MLNSVFIGLNKDVVFNYDKVEKYVQIFTKNHIIVFVIADLSSMILMPVLVDALNYFNGAYDYTVWYLPLVTMFLNNMHFYSQIFRNNCSQFSETNPIGLRLLLHFFVQLRSHILLFAFTWNRYLLIWPTKSIKSMHIFCQIVAIST